MGPGMGFRIGVDIGGTFTDAVAIDDRGRIRTAKALTTPGHLHDGVLAAVEGLDVTYDHVDTFIHGTTAGLNAFLERRGANVAGPNGARPRRTPPHRRRAAHRACWRR